MKWVRNTGTPQITGTVKIAKRENLRKKNQPDKTIFCNFYNNKGHCRNGDKCRYLHDPKRIKICAEYIKNGACKIIDCKMRHAPDPHTMVPCAHFLRGNCTKGQNCPFPHIKVAENARLCINFQQGYCHQGDQCRLKHERKKKPEKPAEPDQLADLKPFKSSAEIEAERLQKDLEESKNDTGWRSRFRIPGKSTRLLPSIKTMKSNL